MPGTNSKTEASIAVVMVLLPLRQYALFLSCGPKFVVRFGELIVLDQAGKVFEPLRSQKDPHVRRRSFEIVDRGGIGFR